ncbi:MAG: Gfo/Idh/MocA family oxidoreductase [Ferruginibacter sp.]|nr:Gfo/Idh/MocA family oxidoreductase [Cytophagales bacterium]
MNQAFSRRQFVMRAGYGAVVAGLGGALPRLANASPLASDLLASGASPADAEKSPTAERKAGWAIVGLGKYATQQIIPAFADSKRSKLVALVSGSPDKARALADQNGVDPKNVYSYQNFDAIRDNPAVDIVYIILPNSLHAEYTVRGAKAGKHIISEKPMATSVKDCQTMIDACQAANRKLMIGYRAQYEPFNLKAIEMARGKQLGTLKLITADHGRHLDPGDPADQWRMKKDLAGGGSLMDIGIYNLNAARYLTGEEPIELSAMLHSTPGDPRFREVEENASFTLRFPSGVIANCTSSYSYQDVKRYRVFGTDAWLDLDPATEYYEHRMKIGHKDRQEEIKIKEESQFARQMDHFSECVLDNKPVKTPGEEGLRDVRLMMAIYEAARTGKTVKLS